MLKSSYRENSDMGSTISFYHCELLPWDQVGRNNCHISLTCWYFSYGFSDLSKFWVATIRVREASRYLFWIRLFYKKRFLILNSHHVYSLIKFHFSNYISEDTHFPDFYSLYEAALGKSFKKSTNISISFSIKTLNWYDLPRSKYYRLSLETNREILLKLRKRRRNIKCVHRKAYQFPIMQHFNRTKRSSRAFSA